MIVLNLAVFFTDRVERILKAHLLKRFNTVKLRNGIIKCLVIKEMVRIRPTRDSFGNFTVIDIGRSRFSDIDVKPLLVREFAPLSDRAEPNGGVTVIRAY